MYGPGTRGLKDLLTYWGVATLDSFGQASFDAPILIHGKWFVDSQMVRNAAGDDVNTHHVVYLDTDVEIEGYLAMGDHTGTPNPLSLSSLGDLNQWGQIKAYFASKTLRNLSYERRAHLT